jgi:serine/threonine protein kinase/tetratricopeptide (TPR) repeat protein
MPESNPGPQLPSSIGAFRLLDVIGSGGMGVVYRAVDGRSGSPAAVKTVRNPNPKLMGAIRSEIAALRSIQHPGVVRVLDHGLHEGLPWYAMELLEGRSLKDFNRELWRDLQTSATLATSSGETGALAGRTATTEIADPSLWKASRAVKPLPVRPSQAGGGRLVEALALYRRLCLPIAHLHTRGIVHRDLKPANIFIRHDGAPVLVDFGLISHARGTIGRESLQPGEQVLGTVSYVSPEQVRGLAVDARADLYSLGCMLYETVTGRPPFLGGRDEVLHRRDRPPPAGELVEGVPPELDALLAGLLAPSPQDRIGYAADVVAVLSELIGQALDPTQLPAANYLYRPQMAGRQELSRRLGELASRAEQGQGGVVLLGGESGIGKTFLLSELQRQLAQRERTWVITGECLPLTPSAGTSAEFSGGPLHPLRRLFQVLADECHRRGPAVAQRLLGRRAPVLAAYEPALAAFAGAPDAIEARALPPQAARERVLHCLSDTLAALSEESVVMLLLDDLQWADELTLAFLATLTPEFLQGRPLLVVGTFRDEEVRGPLQHLLGSAGVQRIPIGSLDEASVGTITTDMLAMPDPPAPLVHFLATRSVGNPFFLAEYLRLFVAEGLLQRRGGRWVTGFDPEASQAYQALPDPHSIQDIVSRRLAALANDTRAIVEVASVLGREFPLEILAAVLGRRPEALAVSLREAATPHLVEDVDGSTYRFSHDKLRESAYAEIVPERLRELHRAAARAIESAHARHPELPVHHADLARHYTRADDPDKSIEYLEKAARDALSKSANGEAVAFLDDLIARVARSGVEVSALRRARWHRQAGEALAGLGRLEESVGYLRKATAILGHPATARRGWLVLSLLSNVARQTLHRLFPRLFFGSQQHRAERFIEAARTHDRLMQVLYFSGDALAMTHACISSLNLAELAGHSPELATAYTNGFAVAGIIPARGLARSYYRRACDTNQRIPDPLVESYLRMLSGIYAVGIGAWEDARRELERGRELTNALGYRRGWEEITYVDAVCDYLRGDFDQSLAKCSAMQGSAVRGDTQVQCWVLIQRAQIRLVQGRLTEALADLGRARAYVSDKPESRVEYLWFHATSARALLRSGDQAGALQAARRALARMRKSPPIYFAWMQAFPAVAEVFVELAARAARGRQADQLAREAGTVCGAMKAQARIFPAAASQARYWEGRLQSQRGKQRAAVACWEAALVEARRLGMRYNEAAAVMALGLVRTDDQPDRQRRLVAAATETFRSLGAEHDLAGGVAKAAAPAETTSP